MAGETYQDDYRGFDAREEENGRGLLVLALALGVLLVFGAVVWNAYRQGIRGNGELPIIAASNSPFKRAPTERQPTTPNTDIKAYDQIDGSSRTETVNPVTVREEIVDMPLENNLTGAAESSNTAATETTNEQTETVDETVATSTALREVPTRAIQPLKTPEQAHVEETLAAPPLFNVSPNGGFLVQLMAVRAEDEARLAWSQFSEEFSDILYDARMDIQRADLGAKGIFFRLRVSGFDTREEAGKFCDELKRRGQDCIAVQR